MVRCVVRQISNEGSCLLYISLVLELAVKLPQYIIDHVLIVCLQTCIYIALIGLRVSTDSIV